MSAPPAPPARAIDHLEALEYSPIGRNPVEVLCVGDRAAMRDAAHLRRTTRAVLIGLIRGDVEMRPDDLAVFDVLLTDRIGPTAAVVVAPAVLDVAARALAERVEANPHAATMLCQILRAAAELDSSSALAVESLAYSALLGGGEFRRWLAMHPMPPPRSAIADPPVRITRSGDHMCITLADPGGRNAMSAPLRDALYEALAATLDDPSAPSVTIDADGACFSVGGDLREFGQSRDFAQAHAIRMERSCARLIIALGDRCTVRLHGACIGSGIEVAAAATHRFATADAYAHLPEVGMGLIPGAGGTFTLSRAIGRHRAAYLALSGRRMRIASDALRGLATVSQ